MNKLIIEAYGKINLGLNVIGKRKDGYHDLKTIMQEIDLKDIITIENREKGIEINCTNKEVPLDESNLVYKAWEEMKKHSGVERGVSIEIDKTIPIGGGLAGGSTNAAAVIKGLNTLWELNWSDEKLENIGSKIGSDVPFFIKGGTALGTGTGTDLEELTSFSGKDIILINPNMNFCTENAYESLYIKGENEKIEKMIKEIEKDNLKGVSSLLNNDLEKRVLEKHPIIKDIKDVLLSNGALGSLMSGSGSTVFGIFSNEEKALNSESKLKELYEDFLILKAKTI